MGRSRGHCPRTAPSSARAEHGAALLSKRAHQRCPTPSPVRQGHRGSSCAGVFYSLRSRTKYVGTTAASACQGAPFSETALQAVQHHSGLTWGGSGKYTHEFQVCRSPGQVTGFQLWGAQTQLPFDGPSPGGQLVPERNPATQQRATDPLPGGLLAQADTEEAGKLRCHTAPYSGTARRSTFSCSLPRAQRDRHSLTGSKCEDTQKAVGKCESRAPWVYSGSASTSHLWAQGAHRALDIVQQLTWDIMWLLMAGCCWAAGGSPWGCGGGCWGGCG